MMVVVYCVVRCVCACVCACVRACVVVYKLHTNLIITGF